MPDTIEQARAEAIAFEAKTANIANGRKVRIYKIRNSGGFVVGLMAEPAPESCRQYISIDGLFGLQRSVILDLVE